MSSDKGLKGKSLLGTKPFLKWAGGKRWLLSRPEFKIPEYSGIYIEPFVGGGAVFFAHRPDKAIISDANKRLIDTYKAIKSDWKIVYEILTTHQSLHCRDYYYDLRSRNFDDLFNRAAQFLYLNRTCWNGLYRENLRGDFNVPIGTKSTVIFGDDDFEKISDILSNALILNDDFEIVIDRAVAGDFIFVDPPYTVAHNFNGFVKYNQTIFSWDDQVRLKFSLLSARERGVRIAVTNAAHDSIRKLYEEFGDPIEIERKSIISGNPDNRRGTSEFLYVV